MEDLIRGIGGAYSFMETQELSLTMLITIAGLFFLAFLFAIREAFSWFLKVDDIKKDLRRIKESTAHLEGEIKMLQNLVLDLRTQKFVPTPETPAEAPEEALKPAPPPPRVDSFPISH